MERGKQTNLPVKDKQGNLITSKKKKKSKIKDGESILRKFSTVESQMSRQAYWKLILI